jgi:hypothetical protein
MPPRPRSIHRRFGIALLREALAGAGKVHLDYRVDNEPEWVHGWVPRRSANDPAPPPPPDPDPKKRLGQGILGGAMDAAGMVPLSVQVGTEPTFLEFYFEPDPSGVPAEGLLGRMTVLRRGFGLEPRRTWPKGIYFGPPAVALQAIVLRELPATRDTLLLRLLGAGDVLETALAEQAALAKDAPERRAARAALLAVSPADEPVPIEEAVKNPVLHACRKTYRQWARVVEAGMVP